MLWKLLKSLRSGEWIHAKICFHCSAIVRKMPICVIQYSVLVIHRISSCLHNSHIFTVLWWNYVIFKLNYGTELWKHEKCSACFQSNIHIVVYLKSDSNLCNKLMLFVLSVLKCMVGLRSCVSIHQCFIHSFIRLFRHKFSSKQWIECALNLKLA